jgi:hypothetical protein
MYAEFEALWKQVNPLVFDVLGSVEVTEDGVKIRRRRGRPLGKRDSYKRERRYLRKPDPDAKIDGIEEDAEGNLRVVKKTVGEVALEMKRIMDEDREVVRPSPVLPSPAVSLPPGEAVGKRRATSTPVDKPSASVASSSVVSSPSSPVVPSLRLNFKRGE